VFKHGDSNNDGSLFPLLPNGDDMLVAIAPLHIIDLNNVFSVHVSLYRPPEYKCEPIT